MLFTLLLVLSSCIPRTHLTHHHRTSPSYSHSRYFISQHCVHIIYFLLSSWFFSLQLHLITFDLFFLLGPHYMCFVYDIAFKLLSIYASKLFLLPSLALFPPLPPALLSPQSDNRCIPPPKDFSKSMPLHVVMITYAFVCIPHTVHSLVTSFSLYLSLHFTYSSLYSSKLSHHLVLFKFAPNVSALLESSPRYNLFKFFVRRAVLRVWLL